jgi:hypothetical protein
MQIYSVIISAYLTTLEPYVFLFQSISRYIGFVAHNTYPIMHAIRSASGFFMCHYIQSIKSVSVSVR